MLEQLIFCPCFSQSINYGMSGSSQTCSRPNNSLKVPGSWSLILSHIPPRQPHGLCDTCHWQFIFNLPKLLASDLPASKFRSLSIFPISLPEWNDLTGGTEVYSSTYSLFMTISDHQQWHFGYFIFESILQLYSKVQTRSTFYSVWHLECRNTINIFQLIPSHPLHLFAFCLFWS